MKSTICYQRSKNQFDYDILGQNVHISDISNGFFCRQGPFNHWPPFIFAMAANDSNMSSKCSKYTNNQHEVIQNQGSEIIIEGSAGK